MGRGWFCSPRFRLLLVLGTQQPAWHCWRLVCGFIAQVHMSQGNTRLAKPEALQCHHPGVKEPGGTQREQTLNTWSWASESRREGREGSPGLLSPRALPWEVLQEAHAGTPRLAPQAENRAQDKRGPGPGRQGQGMLFPPTGRFLGSRLPPFPAATPSVAGGVLGVQPITGRELLGWGGTITPQQDQHETDAAYTVLWEPRLTNIRRTHAGPASPANKVTPNLAGAALPWQADHGGDRC